MEEQSEVERSDGGTAEEEGKEGRKGGRRRSGRVGLKGPKGERKEGKEEDPGTARFHCERLDRDPFSR